MDRQTAGSLIAAVLAVVVAGACGGSNPASPSGSGSGTVAIQGVVLGSGSGSSPELTAAAGARSASGSITVTVEGTGITTTVSANGTFELGSVPGGTFTLVFIQNGVEIGRVVITAAGGAEVKIVMQVQSSTLVVVNITIDDKEGGTASGGSGTASPATCSIISGGKVGSGIEIEGNVSSGDSTRFEMTVNGERASGTVVVDAGAASFKCNGGKPGSVDCKASLGKGDKVHVRGTLMKCDTAAAKADVTATEVMVQKGA
jgi:hypothetical protein